MTKIMIALLGLSVLGVPAALQGQASDYQWTTNSDGTGVIINVYDGPGGNVIIPDTLTGLPVVSIASRAFEQTNLTSVLIPNTVTSLGSYAFFGCNILTNVTLPNSLAGIGNSAFEYCTSLPSIVIPEGITSVGEMAFSYCTSLTNVTIGDSVNTIGNAAFFECESLTSVNLPDSVTNIGETAFLNCASLGSIAIPGSVGTIASETFEYCGLTNVTIAEGVTNIGEGAFYFCDSLTTIDIPDGVTKIGVQAFDACASLVSLRIPASVTAIAENAFTDCTSLSNLYFQGNAPTPGASVFLFDNAAKAYYLSSATGWKSTYAGIPTELTPNYFINVIASPVLAHPITSGKGHYLRGTTITVSASTTNQCYDFLGWFYLGKVVSTNLDYTFTALKNETLFARFSVIDYVISTTSSPTNGGLAVGGGKKICGSTAILRAIPRDGFGFTGWTSNLVTVSTNKVIKFPVSESESFVANFVSTK